MKLIGLVTLKFIKPVIIDNIIKQACKNQDQKLDGLDLKLITLSGIRRLKIKQPPVVALFTKHPDFGLHYISPYDQLISAFEIDLDTSKQYGYSIPSNWWK